jgi:hypothetical protein
MRVAALVMGIIGGILGIFVALFLLLVGGFSKAVSHAASDPTVTANLTASEQAELAKNVKSLSDAGTIAGGIGIILIILCILGIVGGGVSLAKPPIGALMMAIAAVGGFLCVSIFWGLSGVLLGLGAVFALVGSFQKQPAQAQPALATPQGYYPPQQPGYYPQPGYYQQPPAYPQAQGYQQPGQYAQPGFPPANGYNSPQANQGYPTQPQQAYPYPQDNNRH